ncbi:TniQ family protein [Curvibacter sp. HBC28]|uniref:TniQ family protein n=1 Tax=Curvibacter microcysteis TaxID=3026419 RepID=A0ABT5M9X8_9BURK|nr:TniQ family protein [Curvibacter sp. HBC28]MDD0813373.1 TniQ family protein [Curvibacter sp. HBC28]
MSILQLQFDCDQYSLPIQDDIWPGESGQGYVLRMAASNGLGGIARVKKMLGCSRFQTLCAQDAPQLAQWFGASVQRLSYALESTQGGRRVEGLTYMGHNLGRSYFLNRSYPRVCPDCVNEFGYCRAAWDFTLCVACARHHRLLIDRCPACSAPLKWTRPALCLCDCGHPWTSLDFRSSPTDGELFIAQLIDHRMDDQNRISSGASPWRFPAAFGFDLLRQFMADLSMDGLHRALFAFATAAGYESDTVPERRLRAAMPKAQQTISMSMAVGVKLTQQERFFMTSSPSVLIDLLSEAGALTPASPADLSIAQSLLGAFGTSGFVKSSKQSSLAQLVLF